MWEGVAVAVAFGVVFAAGILAAFRIAVSVVERSTFAAFARAEKTYQSTSTENRKKWAQAESIDKAAEKDRKGHLHPHPDIPPHPGNLGKKDPLDWVKNLGTEKMKRKS